MPKKTIRDITINKRAPAAQVQVKAPSEKEIAPAIPVVKKSAPKLSRTSAYTHSYVEHTQKRSYAIVWWILVLVVIGLVVWTLLGRARITITPDQSQVEGNVTLAASKEISTSGLEYKVIMLDDIVTQSVPAGEATFVEEKASGTIVIYNEEASAQRFIEETRFETPEGLIFKLPKGQAVTVPAKRGTTPGSLEVTVYADEVGERYNIPAGDFVIPGWRETKSPKFTTQYARAKTPMSGGFSGMKRTVTEVEQIKTQQEVRNLLTKRLEAEAMAQIPQEFIFFPHLANITFTSLAPGESDEVDRVLLREQGNLYGLLFHRGELSELLAKELVPHYQGEPIMVTNFDELDIQLVSPEVVGPEASTVQITVSGNVAFEWQIDTEAIKASTIGIAKKDFNATMAEFTGIYKAHLATSPVWLWSWSKVLVEVVPSENS
ncbi:MAG: hypothetical protein KBC22_01760 [Candidatus Pacebacteria bacterium]|nr:hypothetical protein [Candidatus Paceibacterota bacterium]